MIDIEICIDVPDLAAGLRFYGEAFGFELQGRPYPGVALLTAGAAKLTLLEKRAQTRPSPASADERRYARHWTPVHLDFHVDDVAAARDRALRAGATQERFFEDTGHGALAVCADPFGHGFCLLQCRPTPAA